MRSRPHGKVVIKLLGVLAALVFIGDGFKDRSEITGIQKQGKLATVEPIARYHQFKIVYLLAAWAWSGAAA